MSRRFGPGLGLLLLASGLAAQEVGRPRASEPAPPFPAEAEIVWIDVTALDAEGRPVADLGREDFEVEEGGERRPILAFRAPEPAAEARGAGGPPGPTRLSAVFLVEDFLARAPHVERALDAVRRMLSRAVAGDRILLAAPASGVAVSAVLPAEAPALAAQLERIQAHPEPFSRLTEPGEIRRLHASRVDAVVNALLALQGHPGARALILVGPSLPYAVDGPFGRSAHERLMRASQRAAAPVYFLSCGSDPLSAPSPDSDAGWTGGTGAVAGAAPLYPTPRGARVRAGSQVFEAVAAETGGFATPSPAAWDDAVERVAQRARASYLLGIPSLPDAADGRYHRVEVRVNRAGVRLHARGGYFSPEPGAVAPQR